MLRPLVITQLLHLPWARKPEITYFLAQDKCRSCVITNGLKILWASDRKRNEHGFLGNLEWDAHPVEFLQWEFRLPAAPTRPTRPSHIPLALNYRRR